MGLSETLQSPKPSDSSSLCASNPPPPNRILARQGPDCTAGCPRPPGARDLRPLRHLRHAAHAGGVLQGAGLRGVRPAPGSWPHRRAAVRGRWLGWAAPVALGCVGGQIGGLTSPSQNFKVNCHNYSIFMDPKI